MTHCLFRDIAMSVIAYWSFAIGMITGAFFVGYIAYRDLQRRQP